jgi:hypothetical protein
MSMEKPALLCVHPYDRDPEVDPALPITERVAFMSLLSAIIDEMPDSKEKWTIAFALGTTNCCGLPVEKIAALAKCEVDHLLKTASKWCIAHQLHASPQLKHAWRERMKPTTAAILGHR